MSITVRAGEIHAICGENGAGKSTLMKVLSGVYPYGTYEGEILLYGEEQRFRDIAASEQAGIVIIHQELALIPELSITENIFLGNEIRRFGRIDWQAQKQRTIELLARVGLREDPDVPVKTLGVGKQQLIEIAKALNKDVKLLILDEPTAALNENDSQHLLDLILGLKAKGIASIIISHKLNEIEQIADEITIIRDGRTVETLDISRGEINEDRIIRGMVGRSLESRYPDRTPEIGEVFFEVKDWWVQHPTVSERMVVKGSSLNVRRGEVVGIAGLMGAGRTEFAMSIFGRSYGTFLSGTIIKDGQEIALPDVAARSSTDSPTSARTARCSASTCSTPSSARSSPRSSPRSPAAVSSTRAQEYAIAEQYRKALRIKTPIGRRGRRQAVGRQPAEGRAGEVDVHRPRPADPRRAHPRHRRRREVRDLRDHQRARRPRARASSSSPASCPSSSASPTASTPSSKVGSPTASRPTRRHPRRSCAA